MEPDAPRLQWQARPARAGARTSCRERSRAASGRPCAAPGRFLFGGFLFTRRSCREWLNLRELRAGAVLCGQCGHFSGADHQGVADDLVFVFEKATLGRAGGARAVLVVRASVARTQKKLRLREPAHRAAEMRTVDGEDLEIVAGDAANPAGNVSGFAIPVGRDGI